MSTGAYLSAVSAYNEQVSDSIGLMEFAGVDKTARSKMVVWKMQELTYRHGMARVDNAGVDISARCGKGGQCGRNNTVTKAATK